MVVKGNANGSMGLCLRNKNLMASAKISEMEKASHNK
jgi:hypothetical protein